MWALSLKIFPLVLQFGDMGNQVVIGTRDDQVVAGNRGDFAAQVVYCVLGSVIQRGEYKEGFGVKCTGLGFPFPSCRPFLHCRCQTGS